jgi:hypothetical protein
MADLTITAANVLAQSGSSTSYSKAAVAITAGQVIYVNGTSMSLAQATSSAASNCAGIALNNAAAGQPLAFLTSGPITIGATVVVGGVYAVAADNAGAICPIADILTTGDYITVLGVATNSTTITVDINASLTAHA